MSDLLKVEHLVKHYARGAGWGRGTAQVVRAVDDVSFCVARGSALGLVGESGCGKSTLSRALLRLIEPDAGALHFDGIDLRALGASQLRALRPRMQIVFQDPYASLNPRRTVRQALEEPLRVHRRGSAREIAEKVAATLAEVGLPPSALDAYPHAFSGGQRQRIGIARALVLDPDLIIADEPVSALDVSVQAQILQLLERLRAQRGLSFVFVSHDLGVIRHFCDSVCVMYLGRIVEQGPTRQVLDAPAHPYTALLRLTSPVPDPRVRAAAVQVRGEMPSPLRPPPGCAYHPRCERAGEPCRVTPPELEPVNAGQAAACYFPLVQGESVAVTAR